MQRYKYENYEEYLKIQKEVTERKINTHQWAKEADIKIISDYIKENLGRTVNFGLCHGVRSGKEVRWFRKNIPVSFIIGTDIIPNVKDVVSMDFNKISAELVSRADFIYSNSFDHAYDPEETLMIWSYQLKRNGMLIIEHSGRDEKANRSDCLGLTMADWLKLFKKNNQLNLEDIVFLNATDRQKYRVLFVGRRK